MSGLTSPAAIFWSAALAAGIYMILTGARLGRYKPDLAEQLRRLDIDQRIRMESERTESRRVFSSGLLEAALRPLMEDVGSAVSRIAQRLGISGAREVSRKLALGRPEVDMGYFYGEKVVVGLLGFSTFPAMNYLDIHPFGPWPLWSWMLGFAAGFLAPSWHLEQAIRRRREAVLLELPGVLDLLAIAASAGLSLEQALREVAERGNGPVARELRRVVQETVYGRSTLAEALDAMAGRSDVPELSALVAHLVAAHTQGLPLVRMLGTQAEMFRDRERSRLLEQGGRASVRMILPIAVFLLPVMFVILLLPAGIQIMGLGR